MKKRLAKWWAAWRKARRLRKLEREQLRIYQERRTLLAVLANLEAMEIKNSQRIRTICRDNAEGMEMRQLKRRRKSSSRA